MKTCVTMLPSTAMPNTLPTWRIVFEVAEAIPARAGGTVPMMADVIGLMIRPMPRPMSIIQYQKDE